jgi:hypothetical protein
MAQRSIEMLLSMFFVVVTLWGVTVAQIDSSCANVLISLSPCLDYITGQPSTHSSGCCSQFASVMGSQPQCLCEVVNGGASSIATSLNVNQNRALALPIACKFAMSKHLLSTLAVVDVKYVYMSIFLYANSTY